MNERAAAGDSGCRGVLGAQTRRQARTFLPAKLLDSQFDNLEVPRARENVLIVPADGTPEELVATIIHRLNAADAAGG
jgi:gluconokinase